LKILYIHTYYRQRGGEDIVYENERKLMEQEGHTTGFVHFNNKAYAALKFLFLFFNPFSFVKVYREIGKFKPDVIHIHNWFFGASPSVFVAAKLRHVPLIHTIHNFRILCPSGFLFNRDKQYMESISKNFPFQAVRRKVYRNSYFFTFWLAACTRIHFVLRTWQSTTRFICLTENAREIICTSYLHIKRSKIVVKPNFFEIQNVQPPGIEPNRNKNFLFVGRLATEKGIELLLEAFQNSSHSLLIIGDGPLRENVLKKAAENFNISYIGFQNKERIIEEMKKCAALIFPSIAYEQFGLTIIEAFSCGTAVIASDSGSPAELVSENKTGLHFKTGSSIDLIRKLNDWSGLPLQTKNCFSKNTLSAYNQFFTAAYNYQQLLSVYNSVMYEKNKNFQLSH
jgi:glycosyltransferase involved in cell wall biosynthesis